MASYTAFDEIPRGRYGVILADPPWHFKTRSAKGAGRSAGAHYGTMTIEDIKALDVASLALPDAVLLLWGTSPHLLDVLGTLEAWGFTYKGKGFAWAKTNPRRFEDPASHLSTWFMGMGYSSRANTEDCWLGTRGAPKRLSGGVRELIVAPRREHSRKPEEVYSRAAQLFPGPYLDLFSREPRERWDNFGNEASKFAAAMKV